MSYALAAPLQQALYQWLGASQPLVGLVGGHIYDALPSGTLPPLYVTLGAEDAVDRSDKSGAGAEHRIQIAVHSDSAGFQQSKDVAAAICDTLDDVPPALTRGRIVGIWFQKARAFRVGTGEMRRIDLHFKIRVEDA